jgi:hypothetical protein
MKVLLLIATALPFIVGDIITGGQHVYDAQLTDPNVVFAVNGINNLFKTNGDSRPRVAEKIISATSQVVSGVIYRFQIEVSGGSSKEVCNVAVWSRPWVAAAEQTLLQGTPTCAAETVAQPQARSVVGGQQETSLTDPEVQKAVTYLETRINARSNSLYYLKATSATKVTKQVVNGVIYRFTALTFALSSCTRNDANVANALCPVSANALTQQTCTTEIYWNPRETPEYTVNSEDCS